MNLKIFKAMGIAILCAVGANAQTPPSGGATQWPHEYMRGEVDVPCLGDETTNCIWHRLVVDNQSNDTLECHGSVSYDGVNRANVAKAERPRVLLPHSRLAVLADMTTPNVNVTEHGVECKVRQPPDESRLTKNCKPFMSYQPSQADYPGESMRDSEEGPVMLEFSLSNQDGPATDVVVVGSSLWPKLDAAGVKYVSQFKGYTDCKQGRFRVPVSFRLN